MDTRNVIIIGSGPAGLTAALYTARANLQPLLIEGLDAGGQLMLTTMVENFPGHKDGIMGPDLMAEMRAQAQKFGTDIIEDYVTLVDLSARPMVVRTASTEYTARAVIIATGASARLLGLPSERALMGHGVSTCATCDAAFFRDQEVIVVGGGDSAMEEALFLARFARRVYVVHRRDELRASKIMQERALSNDKIEFLWNTHLNEILGERQVEVVRLWNHASGERWEMKIDGVFLAIGHVPNTAIFENQLEMDAQGYLVPKDPGRSLSEVDGVFIGGDVHDHVYRQAVTAAGAGCRAAMDAERYLERVGEAPQPVAGATSK